VTLLRSVRHRCFGQARLALTHQTMLSTAEQCAAVRLWAWHARPVLDAGLMAPLPTQA
jgi:hypothetical protein